MTKHLRTNQGAKGEMNLMTIQVELETDLGGFGTSLEVTNVR